MKTFPSAGLPITATIDDRGLSSSWEACACHFDEAFLANRSAVGVRKIRTQHGGRSRTTEGHGGRFSRARCAFKPLSVLLRGLRTSSVLNPFLWTIQQLKCSIALTPCSDLAAAGGCARLRFFCISMLPAVRSIAVPCECNGVGIDVTNDYPLAFH